MSTPSIDLHGVTKANALPTMQKYKPALDSTVEKEFAKAKTTKEVKATATTTLHLIDRFFQAFKALDPKDKGFDSKLAEAYTTSLKVHAEAHGKRLQDIYRSKTSIVVAQAVGVTSPSAPSREAPASSLANPMIETSRPRVVHTAHAAAISFPFLKKGTIQTSLITQETRGIGNNTECAAISMHTLSHVLGGGKISPSSPQENLIRRGVSNYNAFKRSANSFRTNPAHQHLTSSEIIACYPNTKPLKTTSTTLTPTNEKAEFKAIFQSIARQVPSGRKYGALLTLRSKTIAIALERVNHFEVRVSIADSHANRALGNRAFYLENASIDEAAALMEKAYNASLELESLNRVECTVFRKEDQTQPFHFQVPLTQERFEAAERKSAGLPSELIEKEQVRTPMSIIPFSTERDKVTGSWTALLMLLNAPDIVVEKVATNLSNLTPLLAGYGIEEFIDIDGALNAPHREEFLERLLPSIAPVNKQDADVKTLLTNLEVLSEERAATLQQVKNRLKDEGSLQAASVEAADVLHALPEKTKTFIAYMLNYETLPLKGNITQLLKTNKTARETLQLTLDFLCLRGK